jgi:hypothetical protein
MTFAYSFLLLQNSRELGSGRNEAEFIRYLGPKWRYNFCGIEFE